MRTVSAWVATLVIACAIAAAYVAPAVASGSGGCDPYVNGTVIPVPCSSSGGGSGSGGSGGSGAVNVGCSFVPLDKNQAQQLGLSWPPPDGYRWALMDCLGGSTGPGPQAVLLNNSTGSPAVTPQQLLIRALRELRLPYLGPRTAPPRGHDGLVGLPEWYWIPASRWRPLSVTVRAGSIWATATAVPVELTLNPGGGLKPVTCAGPGTAYDPAKSAAGQHRGCSYVYEQPSVGQPGNAYQASLTVSWRVSWTGSGGAGTILDRALPVTVRFTLRVAQGEALVSQP
ncbi:MAG TPA: hypothetical protein VEV61_03520 [Streptosporangiaceae bacterium]|nr:hypothetical protein [Streptosporangiaceae bacterium]